MKDAMSDEVLRLVLTVAAELFACEVGPTDSFFSMGGDSITAVELGVILEERLSIEVDTALVVEPPDFAALADELATALTAEAVPPVRDL